MEELDGLAVGDNAEKMRVQNFFVKNTRS